VHFALLFGSVARGEDTPDSDLDLLVELHEPELERVLDLSVKLEKLLGRRIDVMLIEDVADNPALLAEAIAEGRVLVDRENRWPQLKAQRVALERRSKRIYRRRRREALGGIDRLLAR
jgi:predicted nucleotidyltransferase